MKTRKTGYHIIGFFKVPYEYDEEIKDGVRIISWPKTKCKDMRTLKYVK